MAELVDNQLKLEHYQAAIVPIFLELAKRSDFPDLKCDIATLKVADIGFLFTRGTFRLDQPRLFLDQYYWHFPHSWNTDNFGTIIDLTASQFNPYLNHPVEDGILIVTQDSPLYGRYSKKEILLNY